MPVSTPNGYLDFTNATPRATKVIATSNVGVGISNPEFSLDVHGSSNVGALTATTATVSGNVYAPNLPLATIGSNLVTWNDSTGVFQDSGGLFSNKLAVVSEQPPSALTGASTTITNHGVYKVTASTGSPENAFDKSVGTSWTASNDYGGGGGTGVYVPGTARLHASTEQGDWIALEFPYKTRLRHLTFTGNTEKANLYATNDGGITWTELKNWESGETTVVVDASENYKKYGLVTTKTTGSATLTLTELRFFAESFAIDGGKVALASAAITGGNTVVDQTGPHARHVVPLRKYPEVLFTEGEFDYNDSTNTYKQAGYTVTASSQYAGASRRVSSAFNGIFEDSFASGWQSKTRYSTSTGLPTGDSDNATFSVSGVNYTGQWVKLELPKKIRIESIVISSCYDTNSIDDRRPENGAFLGSNDNLNWELIKSFSGDLDYKDSQFGQDFVATRANSQAIINGITNTSYYKYLMIVITKIATTNQYGPVQINELEYYGYEEDPPAGDTSVDTTITSQFNLPDTTGVKLYIDGDKGSTATDYSGEGHTLTENNATYDSTDKAWSFTSLATSNVTMSTGDLAMEGTHPHSVSLWFNAANVSSNATLFHVGTAAGEGDAKTTISLTETGHLGWIDGGDNQFLSANTWHNLVYATQGGGGLRTCYLDGRKLGDVSVQDTFGDYPPFAMSGYSQGGYTVSSSTEYSGYQAWEAFDDVTGTGATYWSGSNALYNSSSPYNFTGSGDPYETTVSGTPYTGDWIQMEMPHRIKLDYVTFFPRETNRFPRQGVFAGSNDGENWDLIHAFSGLSVTTETDTPIVTNSANNTRAYKFIRLIITHLNGGTYAAADNLKFYGHKENDTTRFPVSSTVLKYPHVAMTGPAQRGYVATASSTYDNNYEAWEAFNDIWHNNGNTDGGDTWLSENATNYNGTDGLYSKSPPRNLGTGALDGEWIKIEMPHKIKLDYITIYPRYLHSSRAPRDFIVYGSNDNVNWSAVLTETGASITSDHDETGHTFNVDVNDTYYKYFGLVTRKLRTSTAFVAIAELKLYGTEPEDVVARVGEGLDGKVANFRVYDKYLHEEQALELWDAQKDQFGRVTSSVSVYRGHVGIGTTTPSAALTVMDEAHESEEFPPRAMTGYETYMEGHGVFKASSGTKHPTDGFAYLAFNKTLFERGWHGAPVDNGTDGTYSTSIYQGSLTNGGYSGDWIRLDLPYKVKLSGSTLYNRDDLNYFERMPKKGVILGSNDNGESWELVHSWDNETYQFLKEKRFVINSDSYFKSFILVTQELYDTDADQPINLGEWRLFGTRQGQSTLHDGSLTLTKNLTVPRIGPALDADDTPRRDRLVVEYNTSTNPTFEGAVRDTSGRGNDGLFYGDASYDATEKAITLSDGTNDYVESGKTIIARGTPQHTFSFWVEPSSGDHNDTDSHYLVVWGSETSQNKWSGVALTNDGALSHVYHSSGKLTTDKVLSSPGVWYHVAVVVNSTSATTAANRDVDFYINGESYTGTYNTSGSNNASSAYYLDWGSGTYTSVRLGSLHSSGEDSSSSLSTIKLYDTALTAEEVKRLYDMGRCDEGHHVVNFSKTRVGIGLGDGEAPTYTLDVRGQIRSQGSLVTSFTGQHKCVPDEPMEKGLVVSAKNNKFVKLNGALDTGKKAITIDESLPVVSLSNVAQDKACFGVVSRMEEANTTFRIETTNGGVISTIPKTLGDNRVIVNSVGEGAIWVCDANGPLESGDYITTSNVAGYGQKQTGEFLANYTVAKITMDCDFTGSNVAVQAIKKTETLKTVTEDVWEGLSVYDRDETSETQYINESNVVLSVEQYESLTPEEQNTYSETTIQTYYRIQRGENVLDEHGMLQWEDTGATEPGYELRYLDATGQQTDEANCVHRAAFVGCTYHCG